MHGLTTVLSNTPSTFFDIGQAVIHDSFFFGMVVEVNQNAESQGTESIAKCVERALRRGWNGH